MHLFLCEPKKSLFQDCAGKLQCYESPDLRLLAGFPGISNLNNYPTIILAVFQIQI